MKINLLTQNTIQLQEHIKKIGLPAYSCRQILDWIYKRHLTSFNEMTNISNENRLILEQKFDISIFKSFKKLISKDNNCVKYIFELADNNLIETVLLRERNYNTLCVSTQVGCPVGCKFCQTGKRFIRNLEVDEIINEILYVLRDNEKISHLVFMGMGEPFLNFANFLKAYQIIIDPLGFGISKRNITVSTIGIINNFKEFLKLKIPLNIAFSVVSPNTLRRLNLTPIEKTNPFFEFTKLLFEYTKICNRKITLEYTLLKNLNDSEQEIEELINLAKYLKAKINLIEYNKIPNLGFNATDRLKIKKIKELIQNQGINVTVRFRKGIDIFAGCGQLGGNNE